MVQQKPRPLNIVRRVLLLKKVCVKATLNKRLVGGLRHLEVSGRTSSYMVLGVGSGASWFSFLLVLNPEGGQEIAVEMSVFCKDFKS